MKPRIPHVASIVAIAGLVLSTGCHTPAPTAPPSQAELSTTYDPTPTEIARLKRLLGITARSYRFQLRPGEKLLVSFHSQKNGADEKGDTFTHEVPFEVYEKFNQNYPTFEPLSGFRIVDLQLLKPGSLGDPKLVQICVRVPGFDKYFHFDEPRSTNVRLNESKWLRRDGTNRLLSLEYGYENGDVRTLTVDLEITSAGATQ